MPKAKIKNHENSNSVKAFLNANTDEAQKKDAEHIDKLMQEMTKEKPKMWGDSIVGYGNEHLTYASGREVDWFKIGFSPRKGKLSLYICNGGMARFADLLEKLGKHKTGAGCLYVKQLSDIDIEVLKKIIKRALE